MTSACGGSGEYSVVKRSGLTKTDLETLTTSISSTLGIPKLAELKSTVEAKVGSEVKWEIGFETHHKHIVQAPPCGRRTDIVYQRFRTYDFLLTRKGWFGRNHSRSWNVCEAIANYNVQPDIDIWISECQCPKKVDAPAFDIMPAALQIGAVRLGLEVWSSSSVVRLNFGGRLAALESLPDRPIKLDIPKALIPSIVLWLAETSDDPVEATLLPNYEFFSLGKPPSQSQIRTPVMPTPSELMATPAEMVAIIETNDESMVKHVRSISVSVSSKVEAS
jgi:hypothetical protein